MSAITTHVLDTAVGKPAAGVPVTLEKMCEEHGSHLLATSVTDNDGRARALLDGAKPLKRGTYRLTFDTAAYFATRKVTGFYPSVSILFDVTDTAQHYHVPLLLSPHGYSTYRGS